MGRPVRFVGVVVLTAVFAISGYWMVRQAYQGQPATDLRSLAAKACANPVTPAQRTDCGQLAAAVSADESADLSRLALLLSLASTIVAALGTVVVVRSLSHSRRAIEASTDANRIATEATEAQNRAWLSIEVGDFKLTSVNGDLRLASKVTFACHGQTPARDVSYCMVLTFREPTVEARVLREQFADKEIAWTNGALFPGKSDAISFDVLAQNSPHGLNQATLLIGISYRTAFSDELRLTALAWTVHSANHPYGLIDPARPPAQGDALLTPSETFSGIVS